MKHARLLGAAVLSLSACATQLDGCLTPPVTDAGDAQGVLSGSVIYQGPAPSSDAAAVGNTLIFLYREDSPPPPLGSGRPVTFAVLPRSALFGGTLVGNLRSAPFVIPEVPPGRYTVRALLDMDGDFDPFSLVRSSATRGDVGGGLLDLSGPTPTFPAVEVKAGEETAGIAITLSAGQGTFPSDAPAFAVVGNSVTLSAAATLPTRIRLTALQLSDDSAAVERQQLMGHGTPGIAITFGDVDGDGVADDSDGDGFADVYPRVLLRRIADDDPTQLTDDPGLITIPCVVDPSAVLGAWPPPPDVVAQGLWVKQLDVLCLPLALNASVAPPVALPQIPAGRYAVLLLSALGQVWRVPNEYSQAANPVSRGLSDAALPTQGGGVTMNSDVAPGGAVAGVIETAVQPTGPTWVFVFAASAPPPPSGSGAPVASARVAPETYVVADGKFRAPYRVPGLVAGSYVVSSVLDQDRSLDIRVELLAQPTRGDMVSPPVPLEVGTQDASLDLAPSLVIPGDPPVLTARMTQGLTLGSGVLSTEIVAAPLSNVLFRRTQTAAHFLASWRNGGPQDTDGDGLPDVWPRTLLTLIKQDPLDGTVLSAGTQVVLASAVDVAPLAMALGNSAGPPVPTSKLRITAAPSAFEVGAEITPLPGVPAGLYALTLLTESGQVVRPVSTEDSLLPVAYVTTATEQPAVGLNPAGLFVTVPVHALRGGGVQGVVRVTTANVTGPAYVLLFDVANPGPPDGAGLPVTVAHVAAQAFQMNNGAWEAPYALADVGPGTYVVQALLDQDGDFSLLGSLRSTGTAGDVVGAHLLSPTMPVVAPITVAGDVITDVVVSLVQVLPLGPPAFKHGRSELDQLLNVPRGLTLEALRDAAPAVGPDGAVSITTAETSFAVTLRDANGDGIPDDDDHDGLPDLYPRVVLQRTTDATGLVDATADMASTIPVMLDPARYLPALLAGAPAVVTQQLQGLALPVSVDGNGAISGVVDGKYSTAVASVSGQTWRVPNLLSPTVAEAGGGVASQGVLLEVSGVTPLFGGVAGSITVPGTACADVVVVVRDASAGADAALKPPAGLSWVRAQRNASGACVSAPTSYAVNGLPRGTYLVLAFADVDGDFNPFISTMKGPSQGDLGGGALSGATLRPIVVNATVVTGVDVTLPQAVPLEKPSFRFETGWPTGGAASGMPVRTALDVAGGMDNVLSHVAPAGNAFTTSTSALGTWPLVLLARIDDGDPRGLRFKEPLEMMVGQVDDTLFTGPVAARVEVVIAPVRVSSALQPMGPAAAGRYAVVVVNSTGQTWQLPNELDPTLPEGGAILTGSAGQGGVWMVQ